jgi:hypothetical protein
LKEADRPHNPDDRSYAFRHLPTGQKSLRLFRINGAQLRIRRRKVRENAGEKHNCTYRRREQMLKSFFHGFLPSEPNLTQNALIFFVHAHYIIFSGGRNS